MAVQKSKVSRSRRGKRRSHKALKKNSLSIDSLTGEKHLRHHMTPDGFYKGKKIITIKQPEEPEEE
jgi:large subunit ribosomal protein L32